MSNKIFKRAFASCAMLLVIGASSMALADDMVSFATGGYARALRTQEMMDKIDANADHTVSKAEWDEYQLRSFAMMDADGSGVLDHDEFMSAKTEEMVAFATGGYARALRSKEMHARIDADGDGKVTRAEFSAFQDKVFASMDTSNQLLVGNYQFFGEPVRN